MSSSFYLVVAAGDADVHRLAIAGFYCSPLAASIHYVVPLWHRLTLLVCSCVPATEYIRAGHNSTLVLYPGHLAHPFTSLVVVFSFFDSSTVAPPQRSCSPFLLCISCYLISVLSPPLFCSAPFVPVQDSLTPFVVRLYPLRILDRQQYTSRCRRCGASG